MAVFVTIVLDGVGIGAQEDARKFGDYGADTLGHVCSLARPKLPNLSRWGLGNIRPLEGIPPAIRPLADFGRMREVSAGKDSTTGHWELCGVILDRRSVRAPSCSRRRLRDGRVRWWPFFRTAALVPSHRLSR